MKRNHKIILALSCVVVVPFLTASACGGDSPSGNASDANASNSLLKALQISQPIPRPPWSQYRQTVIDAENAEITGVTTTSFFYNMGSPTPIKSCPSIGFPVPITAQLTNPQVAEEHGQYGNGTVAVGQLEPNGVFSGDSTGTFVVCVLPNGTKQVDYWEGHVETEGGPAHLENGQIVNDGASTVVAGHK